MSSLIGLVVRFVVSALVLMLVSFLLPGFALLTFGQALIAAVVIAVIGFIVEALFGKRVSPQNRGIVGFITAAIVIYVSQFIVPGMNITILGSLLAAVVIGVIDLFVPTELR
ncbi:MAG: phage holin family protein [Firmicutes bacterium]|nr:phage holin family protein [Bacillota bacterium]